MKIRTLTAVIIFTELNMKDLDRHIGNEVLKWLKRRFPDLASQRF